MTEEEKRLRTERLVDSIFAPTGVHEMTHEGDCFACDLAAEIAGSIAAHVHFGTRVHDKATNEERDGWAEPANLDHDEAFPDDTRLDMAYRIIAFQLHTKLPGHAPNSPKRRRR